MYKQRLTRSRHNRVLGGVCGGIAQYIGWDSSHVRLLYVLLSVVSAAFPGVLVYLILWAFMPEE
ncbi:MAG: PspC domain-containing protein [Fulvivirga sp.]